MTTITLPDPIPYPKVLKLTELPEIKEHVVYVIKGYILDGLGIIIKREGGAVYVRTSDWDGNMIDPLGESEQSKLALEWSKKWSATLTNMMQAIKVNQALFYFTKDFKLVDIRTSMDKFAGPGMLRDLFAKILDTQEVISTIYLDDETLGAIKEGTGPYAGPLILKSSVFQTATRGDDMVPLYATIRYESL